MESDEQPLPKRLDAFYHQAYFVRDVPSEDAARRLAVDLGHDLQTNEVDARILVKGRSVYVGTGKAEFGKTLFAPGGFLTLPQWLMKYYGFKESRVEGLRFVEEKDNKNYQELQFETTLPGRSEAEQIAQMLQRELEGAGIDARVARRAQRLFLGISFAEYERTVYPQDTSEGSMGILVREWINRWPERHAQWEVAPFTPTSVRGIDYVNSNRTFSGKTL